ncbi:DUF2637 domain-containing protein [Spirillospora albida]|uniref:DUF2637 domain-containing protein n=1 Tax=Spirillospora albida TaxID=58123 RepID=UPI0004BEA860|nr:DUF2637 domain-containing protein [Spirillospora albida]
MSAANRAQVITRWGAIAFMAAAVMTATAGGFAQSYAGLYHWALEHGLRGWKAESFPLLVDLFIIVGELGLFLLAVDAFVLHRRQLLSWLDFFLPLTIALAGWTASLVFNVGHVGNRTFSYQATAAVPPIVSMLGLFVLLRTLHRYVAQKEAEPEPKQPEPQPRAIAGPVTLQQITFMPVRHTGPLPQIQVPGHSGKAIESGATAPAAAGGPAPAPAAAAPAAEPEPELAVMSAAASANGHGALGGIADDPAPAPAEPAGRETTAENLRSVVLEILERRHGDIAGTVAELTAEGYHVDEAEIRRISDNHWFPYAVYRLLAKHEGDGARVARDLDLQGISYDQATLDALVRSWRM